MRLGLRQKLVLGGLAIVVVVSFGFTLLQLALSRQSVEEDLQARAVFFAREVAASIGDRRELQGGARLERQIRQIMGVRRSVLQLDIIAFRGEDADIVATSDPRTRLPFTRADTDQVRLGKVVSRLVANEGGRYWEIMAPVNLEDPAAGAAAGAVAVKFSFDRADALAARTRNWALVLTGASVVVMGVLMTVAVHLVVNRPIQRFLNAIRRVQGGDQSASVRVDTADEFGLLANHFNEMMARLRTFNDELQARVKQATAEADERYREVERLHEALFRMQRNLSHAERLALAGQIMAEVAHEVGAPLQSVAGHVQLLQKDLPPDVLRAPVTRHFAIIQSQLARVTEIITQLLGLTRRHPGEPVSVDLNRLVRDTAELVRPSLAAAGVTLEITPTSPVPGVRGHPNRLQQVVLNLFTNAMDATPPGGTIRVAIRPVADDTHVELEVVDSGRGIPAADLKHIFEPFFSTKGSARGTGLGLFISAQIVREHKGRIDVASEEDLGSTFAVRLPVDGAVA
jgi:two-component system, NtrC family, sensor kinase